MTVTPSHFPALKPLGPPVLPPPDPRQPQASASPSLRLRGSELESSAQPSPAASFGEMTLLTMTSVVPLAKMFPRVAVLFPLPPTVRERSHRSTPHHTLPTASKSAFLVSMPRLSAGSDICAINVRFPVARPGGLSARASWQPAPFGNGSSRSPSPAFLLNGVISCYQIPRGLHASQPQALGQTWFAKASSKSVACLFVFSRAFGRAG